MAKRLEWPLRLKLRRRESQTGWGQKRNGGKDGNGFQVEMRFRFCRTDYTGLGWLDFGLVGARGRMVEAVRSRWSPGSLWSFICIYDFHPPPFEH